MFLRGNYINIEKSSEEKLYFNQCYIICFFFYVKLDSCKKYLHEETISIKFEIFFLNYKNNKWYDIFCLHFTIYILYITYALIFFTTH